ncbi:MAG: hypothetical protein HQK60_00475 [Deltaproteobacteria bacterium]|nr:hypothetical protein [Deltaproteobacteria bacterium]
MQVNQTASVRPPGVPAAPKDKPSVEFKEILSSSGTLEAARQLLSTTRQSRTFDRLVRQDPEKAKQVAALVVERRQIKDRMPIDQAARVDFDALTNRLKQYHINLYNFSQIRGGPPNSIQAKSAEMTPAGSRGISETVKNPSLSPPRCVNQTAKDSSLGQSLVDAARSKHLGKPRSSENCYELMANLLEDVGVNYYGPTGVYSHLVNKAKQEGKAGNAYLTGEGLTGTICAPQDVSRLIISKADLKNPAKVVDLVWQKLEPQLKEGDILSFSSKRSGHTGVVGRYQGEWSYINSGYADHPVHSTAKSSHRVEEETLKDEVLVHVKRARKHNQDLMITLGTPNQIQAAPYAKGKVLARADKGASAMEVR